MGYKDKDKAREYARQAMAKKRNVIPDNVIPVAIKNVIPETTQQYPAIIHALCDPVKRYRLERINAELQRKGLGQGVTYGWEGPDFNIIDSYLKATS